MNGQRPTNINKIGRAVFRVNGPIGTGAQPSQRGKPPVRPGSGHRLLFGYSEGKPIIREYYNGMRKRPVTFSSRAKPLPFYRIGDVLVRGKTTLRWIKAMFPDFEHAELDTLQLLVQILEEEPTFHYRYMIKEISPDRNNRGSGRVSLETWIGFEADDKTKWVRVGERTSSQSRDLSSFYAISVMTDNLQKTADTMQKFINVQMAILDVASGGITIAGKTLLKEAVKETVEKLAKDAVKRKLLKKELAKRIAKQTLSAIGELTQLLSSVTAKATAAFIAAFGKNLIQRYGLDKLRMAAHANGEPTSNVPDGIDSIYVDFTSTEIEVAPSMEKGVLAATQVIIFELSSEAFKKKIRADLKLQRAIEQTFGEDAFIDELNSAFELKFKQFLFQSLVTDNINGLIECVGKAAQATKSKNESEFSVNLAKEIGGHLRSRILTIFKDSLSALSELS